MVKEVKYESEISNMSYSSWHRGLGDGFFAFDIDYVEFRANRGIVALFGVTSHFTDEAHLKRSLPIVMSRSYFERRIMFKIGAALGVPAYYVLHTDDLSVFYVFCSRDEYASCVRMERGEYENFIKNL